MGQGGYITIVNSTSYNWTKTYQHSYQMNSWDNSFPGSISAYSSVDVYVEWNEGAFSTSSDDSGEINYSLNDGAGSIFQIQAKADKGYNLSVFFLNLSTKNLPQGSLVSLGWQHDGYVSFVLSGTAGNYFSTQPTMTSWMQDNLGTLGSKQLRQICITGSHDAGMSTYSSGTAFATECNTLTQSMNIYGQLLMGARYFDIRPVISAQQYYTGHYSYVSQLDSWQGANGEPIESIIAGINSFTSQFKELIILDLSHSLNTDVGNSSYRPFTQDEWNALFAQLSQLNKRYVVQNNPGIDLTSLTLADFIGNDAAVVIVVEENVNLGSYQGNGFYLANNFSVYNSYANTNDLNQMAADQLAKMQGQTGNSYFLLSWTLTQSSSQASMCATGLASSIKDLANGANQSLTRMLFTPVSSSDFPNIIYTDNIVNTDAAALAIAVNCKLNR